MVHCLWTMDCSQKIYLYIQMKTTYLCPVNENIGMQKL